MVSVHGVNFAVPGCLSRTSSLAGGTLFFPIASPTCCSRRASTIPNRTRTPLGSIACSLDGVLLTTATGALAVPLSSYDAHSPRSFTTSTLESSNVTRKLPSGSTDALEGGHAGEGVSVYAMTRKETWHRCRGTSAQPTLRRSVMRPSHTAAPSLSPRSEVLSPYRGGLPTGACWGGCCGLPPGP